MYATQPGYHKVVKNFKFPVSNPLLQPSEWYNSATLFINNKNVKSI